MANNTYCPYCGAANISTNKFCKECGASFDLATEKITSPPQPTYIQHPIQQQPQTVYVTQPPQPSSNGAAVTSLVTGIIGFVLQFIPFINIVSPILLLIAFITGIIGLTRPTGKGMAVAGLILSLINVIIIIVLFVFLAWIFLPFL